ncbi:DUF2867 domain-containing protein [Belliella marina]|uniref:DUF2867 domain-containing protein n=1 Tax=Belliella marina TaxID=1644146 RepID=A0ABW4VQ48_9BACT
MGKVRIEKTPLEYMGRGLLSKVDFSDTFSTTNQENNLREITHLIFNKPPKWVKWLFSIRNKTVRLFGLKTEMPADYNERFAVGGYIGYFRIFSISDHEIVLGADDSHLNFRAIVAHNKETLHNIKVITLVQYNNPMGKIYMGIIKPFHLMVVKRLVKNAYQPTPS